LREGVVHQLALLSPTEPNEKEDASGEEESAAENSDKDPDKHHIVIIVIVVVIWVRRWERRGWLRIGVIARDASQSGALRGQRAQGEAQPLVTRIKDSIVTMEEAVSEPDCRDVCLAQGCHAYHAVLSSHNHNRAHKVLDRNREDSSRVELDINGLRGVQRRARTVDQAAVPVRCLVGIRAVEVVFVKDLLELIDHVLVNVMRKPDVWIANLEVGPSGDRVIIVFKSLLAIDLELSDSVLPELGLGHVQPLDVGLHVHLTVAPENQVTLRVAAGSVIHLFVNLERVSIVENEAVDPSSCCEADRVFTDCPGLTKTNDSGQSLESVKRGRPVLAHQLGSCKEVLVFEADSCVDIAITDTDVILVEDPFEYKAIRGDVLARLLNHRGSCGCLRVVQSR